VLYLQDSCSKGLLSREDYETLSMQVYQTTKRRVLIEMRHSVQGKVSITFQRHTHTNYQIMNLVKHIVAEFKDTQQCSLDSQVLMSIL
jgi:prolyl oligopeptidase PreP (S9A serine peptidase family)